MKKIFAINAGSSSLKFQLLAMPEEKIIAKGLIERIADSESIFNLTIDGVKEQTILPLPSYKKAVAYLLEVLCQKNILQSFDDIAGVGHRVAHGGDYFKSSALIDDHSLDIINGFSFLAPSHNPVNIEVIQAFRELSPSTPNVAVFDTAYHQTLSPEYYMYPLPKRYYETYKMRKYGFHGTSHKFIAQSVVKWFEDMEKSTKSLKIISCHLGNGASICAIDNQVSINTSMGFTPLEGLMMGSRSGDIDPAIIPFLMDREGFTPNEMTAILNKASGLLAVSEISNDLRDIEIAYHEGNLQAALALQMFTNRIAHTIANYFIDLDGADVIVFTAGIGENSALVREKVCEKLHAIGVQLDSQSNASNATVISKPTSDIHVMVLPTNEEIMIARDTLELVR